MRTDKEGYTTEEERKGASRGRDERGTKMEKKKCDGGKRMGQRE